MTRSSLKIARVFSHGAVNAGDARIMHSPTDLSVSEFQLILSGAFEEHRKRGYARVHLLRVYVRQNLDQQQPCTGIKGALRNDHLCDFTHPGPITGVPVNVQSHVSDICGLAPSTRKRLQQISNLRPLIS
nr:hypothetical protein KPSA3_100002 [Pseudomonas syringae pv. actinidiae]